MANELPTFNLELKDTATLIATEMVERLYDNNSVVTGNLVRSIKVQPVEDADGNITYPISLKAYGIYVDNGAERKKGGMPPVQAISEWIKLKRINVPAAMTPQQFAWAIAKNIAKKGQRFKKPKPFIDESIMAALNKNIQSLADAAAVDIANDIQMKYGEIPVR